MECEQGKEIEAKLNKLIENDIRHLQKDVEHIKGMLVVLVPLVIAVLGLVIVPLV